MESIIYLTASDDYLAYSFSWLQKRLWWISFHINVSPQHLLFNNSGY